MKEAEVVINSERWENLMKALSEKELKKAWKGGVRPAIRLLQRGARAELRARNPNLAKYEKEIVSWISRTGSTFSVRLGRGQLKIKKKGTAQSKSHLYLLHWASAGTAQRATRKGYNRGAIEGTHFFKIAVEKNIQPAVDSLCTNLTKSLKKAVEKARAKAK